MVAPNLYGDIISCVQPPQYRASYLLFCSQRCCCCFGRFSWPCTFHQCWRLFRNGWTVCVLRSLLFSRIMISSHYQGYTAQHLTSRDKALPIPLLLFALQRLCFAIWVIPRARTGLTKPLTKLSGKVKFWHQILVANRRRKKCWMRCLDGFKYVNYKASMIVPPKAGQMFACLGPAGRCGFGLFKDTIRMLIQRIHSNFE